MEATQTQKSHIGGILEGLIGNIFSMGEIEIKAPSQNEIREKAYILWEEAGRPESDGVEFWLRAEANLQESNS